MLVLSRKKGESVVVNGNITIVVVDVRGDKARIGIEAPADVAVYRSEILAKSAAANESDEASNVGEAATSARRAKSGVETSKTSKRGKAGSGRGARKKPIAPSVETGESAVETLYLSSESEAYRRSDAAEPTSKAKTIERNASNAGVETVDEESGAK